MIKYDVEISNNRQCLLKLKLTSASFNLIKHTKEQLSTLKVTLSPFKHCRVTLKILPEWQFRLNETSNHFIQGENGGRSRGSPLAVGTNQHTA